MTKPFTTPKNLQNDAPAPSVCKESKSTRERGEDRQLQNIQAGILPKHVAAVHVGGDLSLLQRRAFNVLLYLAYENLLTTDVHTVELSVIKDVLGYNSRNTKKLVDTLESLRSVPIEWNILGKDDNQNQIRIKGAGHLLADTQVTDYKGKRYIEWSFGGNTKRLFYNPKIFALIGLELQREFKSKYALALYENCARFKGTGTTGWIEIVKFHQLMGVSGQSRFTYFSRLKEKVIQPAVNEINELEGGEFTLEFEVKKEGQAVTHIKFAILPKHGGALPCSEITGELVERFGLNSRQVAQIVREHEEAYVRHVLAKIQDYTDRQVEAGKKVNVSAFTVAAFKNKYFPLGQDVPGALQEAQGKTSAAARTRRKEERLSLLDNTEKQMDKDQADTSAWKALYGSLPQERQQELAMAFEEGVVGNGLLRRPWMKEGLKSDLVWGRFKVFLADSGLVV